MNPEEIRRGVFSLLEDDTARKAFLRDLNTLDRMLDPPLRVTKREWPERAGEAPKKPTALLIVRDDKRGGWYFSLYHDARPNSALADDLKQGFVQTYPVSAEIAAEGLDAALKDVLGIQPARRAA